MELEDLGLDLENIRRNLQKAGAVEGRCSVWSPTLRIQVMLEYHLVLSTYEISYMGRDNKYHPTGGDHE